MIKAPSLLKVGGIARFSTVDFPGQLAMVVFCQGCPWRCQYCYNTHLLSIKKETLYHWQKILVWLEKRRGLLDAVVFSGGEPLLQRNLEIAMWQVQKMGFRIGLHTTGMFPSRLDRVLPFTSWVGFDLKAPFEKYPNITRVANGNAAFQSLKMIIDAGIPFEARCTVDENVLDVNDAQKMGQALYQMGADQIVLQRKRDKNGLAHSINPDFIHALSREIKQIDVR